MLGYYPSLQDRKHHEPDHHTDGGQQVAPHVNRLIVNLEQAEEVTAPPLADGTISRHNVGLPKQRGHLCVSHCGREGGQQTIQHRWVGGAEWGRG